MKNIASVLSGISSPNAKLCLPVLLSLGLMAVVLFTGACSDDNANTENLFPTQPPPDTRNWLFTVRGTSGTNIYAAGSKGAMFHYDGNAQNVWTRDSTLTTKNAITELWDAGGGTMYATGHNGLILRNTGSGWNGMSSGTSKDLFGVGRSRGSIYACGLDGTLLKLSGSNWNSTGGLSWILDANSAPTDTILFSENVASLVTVNSFFICGAYDDPNYEGEPDGMLGTKGGVFEVASNYSFPPPEPDGAYSVLPSWILRPLSGEQIVDPEWMLSSTSDPADLSRNYLGTSEGWLFQLSETQGDTVWTKFYPSVTSDPGTGIQDIWLDAQQNVYMVTDEGKIIYQTVDYNYTEGTGYRAVLFESPISLTGIWGVDPGQFYVVGYMDDMLFRCSHDPATGYFNHVGISVDFPDDKSMDPGPNRDKFGRPLY